MVHWLGCKREQAEMLQKAVLAELPKRWKPPQVNEALGALDTKANLQYLVLNKQRCPVEG